MAAETIILSEYDNTTDVVFTKQSQNGLNTDWIDTASAPSAPQRLSIKHDLKPMGSLASDRHTIVASRTVLDSAGKPFTVSASLSMVVPRTSSLSDTDLKDMVSFVMCYLGSTGNTNIATLADGISPSGDFHVDAFTR
jgi:hypothetical protein